MVQMLGFLGRIPRILKLAPISITFEPVSILIKCSSSTQRVKQYLYQQLPRLLIVENIAHF